MNKIRNSKFEIRNSREAGVTLLLSILVLSAVMAIAFSLATILLVEVRVSGDLLRTEPSIYAANSVTEEALFAVGKGYPRCSPANPNNPTADCANKFYFTTQLGTVSMNNPAPTENPFHDPIFQDTVLPTSNTIQNTKNRYALFDPTDINKPSPYKQLSVTYKNTGISGQIHVYVCEYDSAETAEGLPNTNVVPGNVDCHSTDSDNMIYKNVGASSASLPENQGLLQGQKTVTMNFTNPNKQQELIIFRTGGDYSKNMVVQIEAKDAGGMPKGVPYYGETVVDINAGLGGVTRAVRVRVPNAGAGAASPGGPADAATFVGTDTTTQGSWLGTVFDDAGYMIVNHATNYPGFVTVSAAGNASYTWSDPTSNVRALQKTSGGSSNRIASTWYSGGSFTVNLNFSDSSTHRVRLYMLDWDTVSRQQTVEVLDPSLNVLDSRSVSGFNGGIWYVWDLKGNVTFRITRTGGANAVLSGIFFEN